MPLRSALPDPYEFCAYPLESRSICPPNVTYARYEDAGLLAENLTVTGGRRMNRFALYQNSVDLVGFLGVDAESRTTRDGVPFTALSLATKRSWKDGQGEWQSHTDWHRAIPRGGIRSPNSRPA